MVGDQGLPGVRVQDEKGREKKKKKRNPPCARVRAPSQRHIIQFLYSVISAKRREEKKTMRHT